MESSRLVRAVFALLVLATAAAFVLTQALKTETPVVLRFAAAPLYISPDGDGIHDESQVGFDLSEPAEVTFSVIGPDGGEVQRIVDGEELPGDAKHRYAWDGRDDDGEVVPDGVYRMRVARRKEGRVLTSAKTVTVDTRPPAVEIASAEPGVVDPSSGEPIDVRVRYRGPSTRAPEFRVWRTDLPEPEVVRFFRGDDTRSGVWHGRTSAGPLAADGDYAFQVRVRDRAGNEAFGPAERPPTREAARPGTGVAVRRLTLDGPLGVVTAGSLAVLRVGPEPRPFEFTLTRLGAGRPLKTGARGRGGGRRGRDRRPADGRLRIEIPDDARTGVYVVRVAARGRAARWPLVVAGLPPRGADPEQARPLVVLPAITWQGRNPWDSDLDGFADTLADAEAIPAERPFAGGKLGRGLTREAAPLLEYLDRARLAYDLTTDLALARGAGPALGNAPGVAVAGSAIWLPRGVRDRLRAEVVERGKAVAVFGGAGTLRRTVALDGGRLRLPSPPRRDDLFGERTRPERVEPPAPLVVERDRLDLFAGVDSLFGEFGLIDRSLALPDEARLLSAAGREPDEPAFVGYRLGEGTVVRPGAPRWTRQLAESALDVEIPRITRRIWALLRAP